MPANPTSEESLCLLRLLASGARASGLRRLLDSHGSAAAALAAGPRDWASHGLDADACNAIRHPDADAMARGQHWLEAADRHLIGWRDSDYPPLLRRIPGPPAMLFVAGDASLLWRPAFATALAGAGLCVASGLAAGIDAAAHRATLDAGGATLAVLGTGPDIAYPARHRPLLERVAAEGAVVSEHLPGTRPLKQHFPSRNRILAGLSLGTLVVEAAERSGALITARLAADAGREVFALPGSIHNPMARGCHRLLREGAALVETPAEVLAVLGPLAADLARALRGELGGPITACEAPGEPTFLSDPGYNRLWQALGHDPTGMDDLVERTGLTTAELSSMLLALELEGQVAAQHGRYCRIGV